MIWLEIPAAFVFHLIKEWWWSQPEDGESNQFTDILRHRGSTCKNFSAYFVVSHFAFYLNQWFKPEHAVPALFVVNAVSVEAAKGIYFLQEWFQEPLTNRSGHI